MHVLKTVNNQNFILFFFISGILKCFLCSVVHFYHFWNLKNKNKSIKKKTNKLPTVTLPIKGGPQVMLLSFSKRNHPFSSHAWYFHEHKCKATYIEDWGLIWMSRIIADLQSFYFTFYFSYPAEFETFRSFCQWFLLLALILVLNIPKIKTEKRKKFDWSDS